MSQYDFTPADDAALSVRIEALRERIWGRVYAASEIDHDLAELNCLIGDYHAELMMRRQETRALVEMVDVLNAELRK